MHPFQTTGGVSSFFISPSLETSLLVSSFGVSYREISWKSWILSVPISCSPIVGFGTSVRAVPAFLSILPGKNGRLPNRRLRRKNRLPVPNLRVQQEAQGEKAMRNWRVWPLRPSP